MSGRRMKAFRRAAYGDQASNAASRRYEAQGFKAPMLVCVNQGYRLYKELKKALRRKSIGGAL